MCITVKCTEHYEKALAFAKSINDSSLQECLNRLNKMGNVELFADFVPHSFAFIVFKNGKREMNGGLIYHGGPTETFSIQLTPTNGWSIHT